MKEYAQQQDLTEEISSMYGEISRMYSTRFEIFDNLPQELKIQLIKIYLSNQYVWNRLKPTTMIRQLRDWMHNQGFKLSDDLIEQEIMLRIIASYAYYCQEEQEFIPPRAYIYKYPYGYKYSIRNYYRTIPAVEVTRRRITRDAMINQAIKNTRFNSASKIKVIDKIYKPSIF